MKIPIATLVALFAVPVAALAQGARLQLDNLDHLDALAEERVNVTIHPEMLKLASGFMQNGDSTMKEVVAYVRSFKFGRPNAYTSDDVNAIRKQLMTPGWIPMVSSEKKREGELVEIYSWREGNSSGGLAILVAQPAELTVVNIIGPIDLAKLGALQGQFGIPQVPGSLPSPPPAPPPPPVPGRR
jgi:hypothetical protein